MIGNALQFIHRLIVQYCESPVSSPITWCLGIIWIIKSIHALYKMKVKTDELVAEKEAKETEQVQPLPPLQRLSGMGAQKLYQMRRHHGAPRVAYADSAGRCPGRQLETV